MNKEIKIPEGYEAKIEGDKVIIKPIDSEDERYFKFYQSTPNLTLDVNTWQGEKVSDILAYLEKQQPAEWGEEDEKNYEYLHRIICNYINNPQIEYKERDKASKELIPFWERLKSLNPQPKQEWSEEDEQNLNACLPYINDKTLRQWLKDAIHIRYNKPVEWDEEDEQYLLICENALAKYCRSEQWSYPIVSKWLEEHCKVLSQLHWKPSKKQMMALEWKINNTPVGAWQRKELESIYKELKKL